MDQPVDLMTTELRYRVRGPLDRATVHNAESGTLFVRTGFDQRTRAYLVVTDDGFDVRFEAFKRAYWEWQDVPVIHRSFPAGQSAAACRYFNSLALSPGYKGPALVELERPAAG